MQLLRKARVITAIKTPYRSDGKFDLEAYDKMVALQIENGVNGLIIGGTTGEGHLMSWDEHIMLIAHTAKEFGKDILVIGNTGQYSCTPAGLLKEGCRLTIGNSSSLTCLFGYIIEVLVSSKHQTTYYGRGGGVLAIA